MSASRSLADPNPVIIALTIVDKSAGCMIEKRSYSI